MLEFIPFIPFGTQGISEAVWQTALRSWVFNLTELLNMSEDEFKNEVMSNTSLPPFIDQVLNEQMNNESQAVDQSLMKNIFLLYSRLSSVVVTTQLLDIERICSFVIVFSESNIEQVRQILINAVNNSEKLEQNLISTIGSLIDSIQAMPDLLSATKPLTLDVLDRAYVLVRVLDALLASAIHIDTIKSSFDTLDEVLINCYRELIPTLKTAVENDCVMENHAYLIKLSLVSSFNSYADMQFFIPLGYTSSIIDHHRLIAHDSKSSFDTTIQWMTEKLLGYIENSGLESSRNAFVDGPLIMDWEVEFCITEKLTFINQNTFDGDDEQLQFLTMSMEQVRDSNSGTGSWGKKLMEQKANRSIQKVDAATTSFEDVERTSKISQVHDLFPDLGDGFIEACLEANEDDVEKVIMQLLEDKLPESVSGLDRSMERRSLMNASETVSKLIHLESEADVNEIMLEESVLKSRHNIYDNDEFDIFSRRTVDSSKVYAGKKDKGNADTLLEDKSFIQEEKKNVLKLVVDMYEDEYDDTYDDINDAGQPTVLESDDALDIVRNKQAVDDKFYNETDKSESGPRKQHNKGSGKNEKNESGRNQVKGSNKNEKNEHGRKQVKGSDKNEKSEAGRNQSKGSNKNEKNETGRKPSKASDKNEKSTSGPKGSGKDEKSGSGSQNQSKTSDKAKQTQKDPSKKGNKKPTSAEAKDQRAQKDKNKASIGNHNRKANRDRKMAKVAPPPQ